MIQLSCTRLETARRVKIFLQCLAGCPSFTKQGRPEAEILSFRLSEMFQTVNLPRPDMVSGVYEHGVQIHRHPVCGLVVTLFKVLAMQDVSSSALRLWR